MTNDHAFRVIAASTTHSAREVLERQHVTGDAAHALVDLVTSAVLLRETMAPNIRVQGLVRGAGGKGTLVGDSFPDGAVRGLAQLKKNAAGVVDSAAFSLGPGSHLQMMRSLVNGALQQGIVDVAEAGGIGEALGLYFTESEQLVCVARVGSRFDGDKLVASGGFVVQLLPEAERPAHMIMTQRLEDFPSITSFLEQEGFSAQILVDEIVHGMPHTELGTSEIFFRCRCNETLVLSALSSLSKDDIQSMVDDGEGLEIHCDYCGKDYVVAIERLRALLTES
jgi:molecular chaperone Hsp33